jgi:cell wall-associated NlpC family hydrolase
MQPGDLIFFSYGPNGRFLDIGHVAIYAGDGKVVEAASTRLGVVYRPLQGKSSIVMIGRPR